MGVQKVEKAFLYICEGCCDWSKLFGGDAGVAGGCQHKKTQRELERKWRSLRCQIVNDRFIWLHKLIHDNAPFPIDKTDASQCQFVTFYLAHFAIYSKN